MNNWMNKVSLHRDQTDKGYHKKHVTIIAFVCVFAIAVICVFMISAYKNRVFNSYRVLSEIKRKDSNTVKYMKFKSGLLKYSRDGASGMDSDGTVLFNGSYELHNPSADVCGDYAAIADIGGKEIYVYNGNDSGTRVEVTLPIMQVHVANQGMIAVLLEDKESNVIQLIDPYSKTDGMIVNKRTVVQKNGFPIDIDISEDGKKMVTSYMSVQNGIIQSKVTFYNFGEVGKNKVGGIVGMQDFGDEVIGKVEFVNNDTVCVFGEKSYSIFRMKQESEQIEKKELGKEIKSIFSSEEYIGFVLKNSDGDKKYQVVVYQLDGSNVLDYNVDYKYDTVELYNDEIIFVSGLECNILKINGVEKLHCIFDQNVSYVIPQSSYNKYFLINDKTIDIIKLTEE